MVYVHSILNICELKIYILNITLQFYLLLESSNISLYYLI